MERGNGVHDISTGRRLVIRGKSGAPKRDRPLAESARTRAARRDSRWRRPTLKQINTTVSSPGTIQSYIYMLYIALTHHCTARL